jgi:branched-chain amino acid transport system permease protein
MMAQLFQLTFGGLTMGSIYALIAISYSLLFSGLGIINFATGEVAMVGAFVGLAVYKWWGLPYPIALPITLIVMFGFGVLFGLILVRPFTKRVTAMQQALMPILMATAASGMFLTQAANILAPLPEGEKFPSVFGREAIALGNLHIIPQNLWTMGITIAILIAFFFFLNKTKMGAGMRAVAQNRDVAALMGVAVEQFDLWMCGFAGVLGAAGGILIAPIFVVEPAMGMMPGIKGFVAAIIGGFGNLPGAVAGGLILGVAEGFTASFISEHYSNAIVLFILILFLAFRPNGIWGQKV